MGIDSRKLLGSLVGCFSCLSAVGGGEELGRGLEPTLYINGKDLDRMVSADQWSWVLGGRPT